MPLALAFPPSHTGINKLIRRFTKPTQHLLKGGVLPQFHHLRQPRPRPQFLVGFVRLPVGNIIIEAIAQGNGLAIRLNPGVQLAPGGEQNLMGNLHRGDGIGTSLLRHGITHQQILVNQLGQDRLFRGIGKLRSPCPSPHGSPVCPRLGIAANLHQLQENPLHRQLFCRWEGIIQRLHPLI